MIHSFEIPPKAMKLLALALNDGASEGEWQSAAIKAVADMRRAGVPIAYFETNKKAHHHDTARERDEDVMPFGKFKGSPLSEIPEWYLAWILEAIKLRDPLLSKIRNEIERRTQ